MDKIELSEVRLKAPVQFNGPSSMSLVRKDAEELFMLPVVGLIVAKRHGKERIFIPVSGTTFSREFIAGAAPAHVPAPETPPEPLGPPAPVVDVVRFEKDKKTGQIREVAAKVAAAESAK